MAGAAIARELIRFASARQADEAAIRQLLRDNPIPGTIRLTLEREPDYFLGANLAGAVDETIVAFAGDRLVCVGRCSQRDCWVDGRAVRAGYLAELRLDAAARGQFAILRGGYRSFHEQQSATGPAQMYFTSIAEDNHHARCLLERGVRGLPAYRYLGGLNTLLIAVPRRPRHACLKIDPATPACLPEVARLLNAQGQKRQLAAVWTEGSLRSLAKRGLPLDHFLIARAGGKAVACGALWDQRNFRQTVIQGYTPALTTLRPVWNLTARFLGTPRLPRPGAVLAHAFLSPLALAAEAEAMLPDFVEAFFPLARKSGIEFLTLALPANNPRLTTMRRRFSTRTYRSRLYRVDWPDETPFEIGDERIDFLPDVSLL